MTELRIRDVDDAVIEQLKDHAKRRGRTLGDEVRSILADAVERPRREMAAHLSKLRISIESAAADGPDSTAYIRQDRDQRG